jgi:hypothetical protein
VGSLLRRVRTLEFLRSTVKEPPADSTIWGDRLLWPYPDGCTDVD